MKFKELNLNLTEQANSCYDDLVVLLDNDIVSRDWVPIIVKKLQKQLDTLGEWDLLYSEGFSILKFNALFDQYFPELIGNLKPLAFFAENGLILGDEVVSETTSKTSSKGKSNANNTNTASNGYSGFDIANQEGQFVKNSVNLDSTSNNEGTSDGNTLTHITSTNKLKYAQYLSKSTLLWADKFIETIKYKLLRKIY